MTSPRRTVRGSTSRLMSEVARGHEGLHRAGPDGEELTAGDPQDGHGHEDHEGQAHHGGEQGAAQALQSPAPAGAGGGPARRHPLRWGRRWSGPGAAGGELHRGPRCGAAEWCGGGRGGGARLARCPGRGVMTAGRAGPPHRSSQLCRDQLPALAPLVIAAPAELRGVDLEVEAHDACLVLVVDLRGVLGPRDGHLVGGRLTGLQAGRSRRPSRRASCPRPGPCRPGRSRPGGRRPGCP